MNIDPHPGEFEFSISGPFGPYIHGSPIRIVDNETKELHIPIVLTGFNGSSAQMTIRRTDRGDAYIETMIEVCYDYLPDSLTVKDAHGVVNDPNVQEIINTKVEELFNSWVEGPWNEGEEDKDARRG